MYLKYLNKNFVIGIINKKIMFLKFYLKHIFYKYSRIYYISSILKFIQFI